MPDLNYAQSEIQLVLDMGPEHEEDWFRLSVSGSATSKHLNISHRQLAAIRDILADDAPGPDWHPTVEQAEQAIAVLTAAAKQTTALSYSADTRKHLSDGAGSLSWLLRQADFRTWLRGAA